MRRGSKIAAMMLAAGVLATPALASKKDNTLRFASQETLPNADPYFNNVRVGVILADQVWDTLIYRDPESSEYRAGLATAWRWQNERTLELDLRQGVKFHNGAAFGADDVVFTLNFVSKPENKSVNLDLVNWIDHVEKLGPYKVRIVAKRPTPAAIAYLAGVEAVIHPHEYYAKVGPSGMSARPVGTGPFRVVEHALGKHILLGRNPDYYKDSPKARPRIDKVLIRFIPDPQTRVAEAVAGGVDLIMNVAPDQAQQLRQLPSLQIVLGGTMRYAALTMNTTERTTAPPLRDSRVRQAIMYAIDRDAMAKFLVGEGTRILHVECYPSQFGCSDKDAPRYAYDPQKARQLLAAAGYGNGFTVDLYAFRDRNQTEAMIGYLRAVGIRARLRYLQFSAVFEAMRSGKAALVHNSWGSGSINDVASSVSVFHEFAAEDMNRDPEVRDLLLHGDSSMDPNLRKEDYAKALKLIAERVYVLPLYTLPNYYIAARGLAIKPDPDEIPRFYEMSWK